MRSDSPLGACKAASLSVLLALGVAPAPAFDLGRGPVTASLLAEQDGVVPGAPLTLAVRLSHSTGWHSYWLVPGDAGLPTRVNWRLPVGFRAGELQWPSPRRLVIGPLVDFGYEGQTLLLTRIEPPAALDPGDDVRFEAHVEWLMCRDVCIPASADLALTLPARDAASVRPSEFAPAFDQARRRVPQPLQLAAALATRAGRRVSLSFAAQRTLRSLEFFPSEAGRIEPSAPQLLHMSGQSVQLDLVAAEPAPPGFDTLRGVLVADGGVDSDGGWIGTIEVPISQAPEAAVH